MHPLDVGSDICLSHTIWIECLPWNISTRSASQRGDKRHSGCLVNPQFALDNMEDHSIVDHWDVLAIAPLHLLVDLEGALPCDDDTPFLLDLGMIQEAIASCPCQKCGMVPTYSNMGVLLPRPTTLICGRTVTMKS